MSSPAPTSSQDEADIVNALLECMAFEQQGDFPQALGHITNLQARWPDLPPIALKQVELTLACNDVLAAWQLLKEWRLRWPDEEGFTNLQCELGNKLIAAVDETLARTESTDHTIRARFLQKRAGYLIPLERWDEAIANLHTAAMLDNDIESWQAWIQACLYQHQPDAALAATEHLLATRPDDIGITLLGDFARLQQQAGHLDLAIQTWQKLTQAAPASSPDTTALQAIAQTETAHCLLEQKHWSEGFSTYRQRWQTPQMQQMREAILPGMRQPEWQGEPVAAGQTLLIWAEQGLGDTIQFCRFLGEVRERAGQASKVRIFFQVHLTLQRLLAPLAERHDIELIVREQPLPPFDLQIALMDLPGRLKTNPLACRIKVPYLTIAAGNVGDLPSITLSSLLTDGSSPALPSATRQGGLVWRGYDHAGRNPSRDLTLDLLDPILRQPVRWTTLQHPLSEAEKKRLSDYTNIRGMSLARADMRDTAQLVASLDFIISADTGVAHLAAAMGKPVWLLLRHSGEWRWPRGEGGNETSNPWYPAIRIYRQPHPGDWASVIDAVCRDLQAAPSASFFTTQTSADMLIA